MSLKETVRKFNYGPKAHTPVDEQIPDEWEPSTEITNADIIKQVTDRGEPPPKILTRFVMSEIPVYEQPSDALTLASFALAGGADPVQIVPQQNQGVACRVKLRNNGDPTDLTGLILIASNRRLLQASTTGAFQSTAFLLQAPVPLAATSGFNTQVEFACRSELWAVCVTNNKTPILSVAIETYTPDTHTWEPWQAGHD